MRALLLLSLVVAAACVVDVDPPSVPPDITGSITQLTSTADGVSIRIEELPAQPSGGKKARVRTDASTQWKDTRKQKGSPLPGAAASLPVGTRVRVWFAGPAATSYPVEAKAAAILVLPD